MVPASGELAGDREQRRRLAGAVRPEQGDDLAGPHGELEITYCFQIAVSSRQATNLEHRVSVLPGRPADVDPSEIIRRGVAEVGSDHLRVAAHLCHRSGGEHSTLVEDGEAVAGRHHERHVVLDHHHREAPFVGQPPHDTGELGGLDLVEPRRRFVEQEDGWSGGDRPGNGHQTTLAVRQFRGLGIENIGEPELVHHRPCVGIERGSTWPNKIGHVAANRRAVRRRLEVLANRHRVEQLEALE